LLTDGAGDQDARRPLDLKSGRVVDIDERQLSIPPPEVKQPGALAPRKDEMTVATSSKPSLSNVINSSINLDNPSVKQALDKLICSGPNILKNISDTLAQKSAAAKFADPNNRR